MVRRIIRTREEFAQGLLERREQKWSRSPFRARRRNAQSIAAILNDDLKFAAFMDRVGHRFDRHCERCNQSRPFGEERYGSLADFFEWFLENWPSIMKVIMEILSLFSHEANDFDDEDSIDFKFEEDDDDEWEEDLNRMHGKGIFEDEHEEAVPFKKKAVPKKPRKKRRK